MDDLTGPFVQWPRSGFGVMLMADTRAANADLTLVKVDAYLPRADARSGWPSPARVASSRAAYIRLAASGARGLCNRPDRAGLYRSAVTRKDISWTVECAQLGHDPGRFLHPRRAREAFHDGDDGGLPDGRRLCPFEFDGHLVERGRNGAAREQGH